MLRLLNQRKKVAEEAKKVEEATAKATKEAEDVKAAQTKKDEADKAKADAEAELTKAKAEADKAKAKVEELKKEESETRTALKDALDQFEKDIDADANITNKEEAKKALGKEDILAAVEKGDLTAGDVLKELENQNATAEANKDQDPQADEIGATKQEGKDLSELPAADKEKLDAAYNKEASKPIVKKLQDIADDIAEKIEKLTKVADKDKADATEKAKAVEEKNAVLDKQKETLEKAKAALETAKKNNAEQSIQDGLQDAVTRLEAAVASAKTAADDAQAKFDEVNEAVKAYKDAIDELTDDYNATLGYIENLKEVPKGEEPKDFSGGVNDEEAPTEPAKEADEVPTVPNAPEFNGGVNPADAPTAEEKPEFTGGVNDEEAPTTPATPEFNGGVNDEEAPTVPNKPEGEAPAEPKVESSKGEALVQPALPEFKGGVNFVEAAVNEVPELNGGVNAAEAATTEDKPEFDLSKLNEGKLPESNKEKPAPSRPEKPAPDFPIPAKVGTPGNSPRENSDTTAVNEPALVPTTPAAPAMPTAATPATSAVAGTNKDNTYQAPAVKAEDKKELPNTGSVNAGETSVGSRVAKDANKLPSTGDESSILTTVGMAIMSLFGILYIGKHRKNTNKEV